MAAACPYNMEAVGAPPPPNFGLSKSFIFIFVCFCTCTFVSPEKQWAKSVEFFVLGTGYLGPWGTFASPPPTSLHVLSAAVHMLRSTPPPPHHPSPRHHLYDHHILLSVCSPTTLSLGPVRAVVSTVVSTNHRPAFLSRDQRVT